MSSIAPTIIQNCFAACTKYVAVGASNGAIFIFQRNETLQVSIPPPFMSLMSVTAMDFTSDNTKIGVGYSTGAVVLFDVVSGSKIKEAVDIHSSSSSVIHLKVVPSPSSSGKVELITADSSGFIYIISFARVLWWTVDKAKLSSGKDGELKSMDVLPPPPDISPTGSHHPGPIIALCFSSCFYLITIEPRNVIYKVPFTNEHEYACVSFLWAVWPGPTSASPIMTPLLSLSRSKSRVVEIYTNMIGDEVTKKWEVVASVSDSRGRQTIATSTSSGDDSADTDVQNEVLTASLVERNCMAVLMRSGQVVLWEVDPDRRCSLIARSPPSVIPDAGLSSLLTCDAKVYVKGRSQLAVISRLSWLNRLEHKIDDDKISEALHFAMIHVNKILSSVPTNAAKVALCNRLLTLMDKHVKEQLSEPLVDVKSLVTFALQFCLAYKDMDHVCQVISPIFRSFNLGGEFATVAAEFVVSNGILSTFPNLKLVEVIVGPLCSANQRMDAEKYAIDWINQIKNVCTLEQVSPFLSRCKMWATLSIISFKCYNNYLHPLTVMLEKLLVTSSTIQESCMLSCYIILYLRAFLIDHVTLEGCKLSVEDIDLSSKDMWSLLKSKNEHSEYPNAAVLMQIVPAEFTEFVRDNWQVKLVPETVKGSLLQDLHAMVSMPEFNVQLKPHLVTLCIQAGFTDKTLSPAFINKDLMTEVMKVMLPSQALPSDVELLASVAAIHPSKFDCQIVLNILNAMNSLSPQLSSLRFAIVNYSSDVATLIELFQGLEVDERKNRFLEIITAIRNDIDSTSSQSNKPMKSNSALYEQFTFDNIDLFLTFESDDCKYVLSYLITSDNADKLITTFMNMKYNASKTTSFLRLIFDRAPTLPHSVHLFYVNYLYSVGDTEGVLSFLRRRDDYPIEEVESLCQQNNHVTALAYIYEKCGKYYEALSLLSNQINDGEGKFNGSENYLVDCLSFCNRMLTKTPDGLELGKDCWIKLLKYCQSLSGSKQAVLRVYREGVAFIPVDLVLMDEMNFTTPDKTIIRQAVKNIKSDYAATVALRNVMMEDFRLGGNKKHQLEGSGLAPRTNSKCDDCGEALAIVDLESLPSHQVVLFGCKHSYHYSCLGSPSDVCKICHPRDRPGGGVAIVSASDSNTVGGGNAAIPITTKYEKRINRYLYSRAKEQSPGGQNGHGALNELYDEISLLMRPDAMASAFRLAPRVVNVSDKIRKNVKCIRKPAAVVMVAETGGGATPPSSPPSRPKTEEDNSSTIAPPTVVVTLGLHKETEQFVSV
jgi:hypothetical protein